MSYLNDALEDSNISLETIQSILHKWPHLIIDESIFVEAFRNGVSLLVVQLMVEQWVKAKPLIGRWNGYLTAY